MKYTEPYRKKYATRKKRNSIYNIYYTPAGSKDVTRLCDAVDGLSGTIEAMLLYDVPANFRDRMNMILMRLEEGK